MKTNEFGGLIDRIEEVFYGTPFKNAYNAKSLILVDLSNDEVFISKRENEQQLPASLAKLFVIKYAVTLADLDSNFTNQVRLICGKHKNKRVLSSKFVCGYVSAIGK